MTLTDTSLRDALAAFSSADPTPGGGSASALASALGTSLLIMVSALPRTRTGSESDRSALASARHKLTDLRDELTAAIDADAAAYDQVVGAYTLPKASADEQHARKAAIGRALRAATDVPLGVMRLSAAALAEAAAVAAHGNTNAASDIGVAIALLGAGLEGARLNVEINLAALRDDEYAAAAREEAAQHSGEAKASGRAAERSLPAGESQG